MTREAVCCVFVIACFKRKIRVSAKLKAIYCLASMRYICDANAIYTHSARMRYDINSVSRAAGTYLATGISRFHNISQIPTGIYIAEPLCGSTPLSTLHSERIIPHFSVKNLIISQFYLMRSADLRDRASEANIDFTQQ